MAKPTTSIPPEKKIGFHPCYEALDCEKRYRFGSFLGLSETNVAVLNHLRVAGMTQGVDIL
jgi:hypothetical protein